MPKSSIFNIFAQSPIRPLQHHIDCAMGAVLPLVDLFEQLHAGGDIAKAETIYKQIYKGENKADKLKHDIRMSLPNSLFMPMSRTDILELLTTQDSIANLAKDIAGIMLGRQMLFPKPLIPSIRKFLKRSIEAASQAQKAINELDELLETGFKGSEAKLVLKMIEQLEITETHTDNMQVEIRNQLFKMESSLNPVDVMFYYKIIERIGNIANIAQRIGHRLQILLAR